MNILIQADGVTLTEKLKAAIEEKIGRVEDVATRALRARVRIRKVSAHPSPRQFLVRVLVEIPGDDLSAEESGANPLAALDIVASKIERRLRKRKTGLLAKRARKNPRLKEKS